MLEGGYKQILLSERVHYGILNKIRTLSFFTEILTKTRIVTGET